MQKYLLAIEISGKAKVIDGDTIKINNEKIRLLGIDAFEIKQKCKSRNRTKYKCGQIAKSTLIEIISNQPVKCIKEKKDYYKRWLATCYVGKLDIGENMVLLGYAIAFMSKKYKDGNITKDIHNPERQKINELLYIKSSIFIIKRRMIFRSY